MSESSECGVETSTYSRVRTVGADGDEADVTVTLATRLMIRPNDRQTSVLASGTGIGLKRARSETSDLAEVRLEFLHRR